MKKSRRKLIIAILVISIILGLGIALNVTSKTVEQEEADADLYNTSENIKLVDEDITYIDLTQGNSNDKLASLYEDEEEVTNESRIDEINNDYYNIDIDLSSKTVVADDTEFAIDDFFEITEDELNELLDSKDKILEFLQENMTGDIEYSNGEIQIENSYSTNAIIIECSNIEDVQDYGEANFITRVATDIYCIRYSDAYDTKEGYEILNNDDSIENVCKDYQLQVSDTGDYSVSTMSISDEDYYDYGVITTGLYYYEEKINYSENENEILVAVLDTGIYEEHEVFASDETADRIDYTYSYNYVDESSDVSDGEGHGTAVAGIIAEGSSGNVKIVPVKVLDDEGIGYGSDTIEALATLKGNVDIINISFGVTSDVTEEDVATYEEVLQEVNESGSLIICAAGNYTDADSDEDKTVKYPASSEYTIAVSATDYYENISDTDSISYYSACGDEIDFSAPGSSVYVPSITGQKEYEAGSGTSFSTPLITAAFALLKSENTNSSTDDLIDLLKTYCTDLGDEGWDKYFGYGAPDFGSLMFGTPVIVTKEYEVLISSVTVQMEAICSSNIIAYSYTTDLTEDLTWTEISDEANIYELELTFSENGNYYVYFKDENGNSSYILVEITTIADTTAPVAEVSYSTTEITNGSVTVTITADEEIQEVDGWTLSEDGYTLTKEYTENTTETVTIYDLSGNSAEVEVEITNIDTAAPTAEVSYSTTETTEESVTVTITADEEIQEVDGWTLSEDGYTLTKEYTENTTEAVTIYDLAGNSTEVEVTITNISTNSTEDEEDTKETYILYLYDGDTLYSSQEITEGDYIYVDDLPTLSQSGYTFNGWTDADGNIIEEDIEVTGDITLYASWTVNSSDDTDSTDDVETYTITLNLNGGYIWVITYNEDLSEETTAYYTYSEEIESGNSFTYTDTPERDNYEFAGWEDEEGNVTETIYVEEVTADMTFTALWTEDSTDNNTNSDDDDDDNNTNTGTTNSNSSTNSSTTTNSNTSTTTNSTNTSTTNSDSSTSTTSLPYTGTKTILIGIIAIFGAIAFVVNRKWKNLKGI